MTTDAILTPEMTAKLAEIKAKRAALTIQLREVLPILERVAAEAEPLVEKVMDLSDAAGEFTPEEEPAWEAASEARDADAIVELHGAASRRREAVYEAADAEDFRDVVQRLGELLENALEGTVTVQDRWYGRMSAWGSTDDGQLVHWAEEQTFRRDAS